jgi:ABC-type Mn2+/Zn2+ transport system ATPase subunit
MSTILHPKVADLTAKRGLLNKLSLGQQQSVLLSIFLFSKSNEPLVIDQPEDNLDSEFIYKTFVRSLRRVK